MGTEFTQEQFAALYPDGIKNHFWNRARNRILRRFLERNRCQNDPVLEIGCGRGIVVEYLRSVGMQCSGVELGQAEALSNVRDLIQTGTDAFDLPDDFRKSIRTILLLDVLEHFQEPETFLTRVTLYFTNVQNIVVTLPARSELWSNYDEYNGHFRRYDSEMLQRLRPSGLQLKEFRYFNHILYPAFWVIIRLFRQRATTVRAPKGKAIFLHLILSLILQVDDFLLPARLPGTSLLGIFKTCSPNDSHSVAL
jgi:hypothetical protein